MISALHPTAVPVPEPVLLCEDEYVLGAPFYVMEFVEGTPYRTAEQLAPLGPERTRAAGAGAGRHARRAARRGPGRRSGLGDFGRPEGFLDRQLRRWGKQLDASRNRELAGHRRAARGARPRAARTPPRPTVVHGDYRLDNVLVGADDRIKAVLDWEMSTLGDPLTDLGLLVMYSAPLEHARLPRQHDRRGAPGHPDPAELIERYAARSGPRRLRASPGTRRSPGSSSP